MANYDSNDMTAMFLTLGINENSVQDLVEEQGIDNLDCLLALDVEGVEALCKNIRNPGGTVHDEENEADLPDARNRGNPITTLSELYLKKTVFYLKHMKRTSRIAHPDDITIDSITALTEQDKAEKKYKEPTLPPAKDFITPESTWPETFKLMNSSLRQFRGTSGIPLSYCVRKNEEPEADPALGWDSYDDEMIARAPITVNGRNDPQFTRDNDIVWTIISTLVSKHECKVQAEKEGAFTRRDGRKAYWNIFRHYCGGSDASHRVSKARKILSNLVYHGETKRFTFDKFIALHQEQHNIINSLKETPEGGIDGLMMVQLLYEGVKDPTLQTVRGQLFANEDKYIRDFTASTGLYKSMIRSNDSSKTGTIQVAAIAQQKQYQNPRNAFPTNNKGKQPKKGKEKNKKGGKNGGRSSRKIDADEIEDRFYDDAEYNRFTRQKQNCTTYVKIIGNIIEAIRSARCRSQIRPLPVHPGVMMKVILRTTNQQQHHQEITNRIEH